MIFPSNCVPKSMADLRKYEEFFPNMSGATYDPISLLNEEKNLRRAQSGGFSSDSTRSSRDDDIFSNTAFASSRYAINLHDREFFRVGLTKSFMFSISPIVCIFTEVPICLLVLTEFHVNCFYRVCFFVKNRSSENFCCRIFYRVKNAV